MFSGWNVFSNVFHSLFSCHLFFYFEFLLSIPVYADSYPPIRWNTEEYKIELILMLSNMSKFLNLCCPKLWNKKESIITPWWHLHSCCRHCLLTYVSTYDFIFYQLLVQSHFTALLLLRGLRRIVNRALLFLSPTKEQYRNDSASLFLVSLDQKRNIFLYM